MRRGWGGGGEGRNGDRHQKVAMLVIKHGPSHSPSGFSAMSSWLYIPSNKTLQYSYHKDAITDARKKLKACNNVRIWFR